MTARCVAARRLLFSPLLPLALVASALCVPGCYGGGQGTDPPRNTFYFPAGLAVSKGGNALYAANSDFDLQWNGGTLQSYDLYRLRHDIDAMILANLGVPVPGVTGSDSEPLPICSPGAPPAGPTVGWCVPVLNSSWRPADCNGASTDTSAIIGTNGSRNLLGETCAPPVASDDYQQSSWIIGAFATQLVLSSVLTSDGRRRLFSPIGGNASVTWADVPEDSPTKFPHDDLLALFQSSQDGGAPPSAPPGTSTFDPNHPELLPFAIDCRGPQDTDPSGRCGASHQAGNTLDDPRNSRNLTLPGEPFALALTLDNSAIAVAHQTSGETSLLLSGLGGDSLSFQLPDGGFPPDAIASTPSMQFVLEGVPSGGDGITAVPHDDSLDSPAPGCEFFPNPPPPTCVRPSFLETNNTTAEIDLLRYYNDLGSSISRPFLDREAVYPLTALEGGTDSRGIVVDPTPRLQCRHAVSEAFQTAVAARVPMSPALQGAASTSEGADEEPPVDPCPIDPGS
ncbi:MAG: hypothetical protein FWD17_16480, partial [Polyangiaceae bacterium]|nr:hypothetical protein [Polyangiaceae bacterium]